MTTPVKIHRNQKKTSALISKKGKIISFTTIRVASKSFSHQAPYPVAIIRLENNQQLIGQLVDYQNEDIQIGQEVITVLRRCGIEDQEGVITYSIKFKPL